MSNFITPDILAAESLDQLDYELVAGSLVYRDRTSDFSTLSGMKVGETVRIRTVSDMETTEFNGSTKTQEINQSKTELTIEKHFDVSVEIGAKERALDLDGVREEIINPAMTSMAQKIDTYLLTKMIESQGAFGSASLLANATEIANARRSANLQQLSKSNRIGLVNDELEVTLLGQDSFTKFDTRGQPAVTALQEAGMGRLMGVDWFSSVNMPDLSGLSVGTFVGSVLTTPLDPATFNVQGQNVITIDDAGVASGTLLEGDKLVIAGAKRMFTVATAVADMNTVTTITVLEEINENLVSLGAAAVTVFSSGVASLDYQGVVFNPGAFGFAAPPLDAAAGDKASVASAGGLSIRVTEAYDWKTKKTYWSFDMLLGAAAVDARRSMLLGRTT